MKPSLISAIFVLALGGYFGYHTLHVRPGKALATVHEQLEEARREQELRKTLASSLKTLQQKRQHLAPKAEPEWLLQEVGRLAKEVGIEVVSLSPQASRKSGELSAFSVSLQCRASYHQLGRFLSRIEHHNPFIRVDELSVEPNRAAGDEAGVRLLLSTLFVSSIEQTAEGKL